MSFSPEWLELREPVDHRSRDFALAAKLRDYFAERADATIFDLGVGLGSNLRGTYGSLPLRQRWVLVDNDPVLLNAARDAIAAWADSAERTADGLKVKRGDHALTVEFKQHDLAADPAPWFSVKADLVTAAALFDLVSEEWIGRFTRALSRSRLPFYTVLTHNAETRWLPSHPADAAMKAAFESHFGGDKGFGPSVGGRASAMIGDALEATGYAVEHGPSPWLLGAGDRQLVAATAEGWAQAVRETGRVPEATIEAWRTARSDGATTCIVGHEDLLALPPRR
jgi:hypothetical protein